MHLASMAFPLPLHIEIPHFAHSRAKISTFYIYTRTIVRQLVYTRVAPLQPAHKGFCPQKLKNMSGVHAMSRDPWSLTFHLLETLWLDPSSPFEGYKLSHIQAFRGIIIESKDTLNKFYFMNLESMNFFCSTPKLFLSWEEETQLLLLLVSLPFAEDWSGEGPGGGT